MESRQVGLVRSLSGQSAVVQIKRKGGCSDKCAHGQVFGNVTNDLTITARNTIGAKVGDWVQVAYDSGLVLRAAFALYILPILLGVVVYLVGDALLGKGYPLLVSVIAGGSVLISFFAAFRHFSRTRFDYTIVAKADVRSLPLAAGCQGCGLATMQLKE